MNPALKHKFVEFIPDAIEEGMLYVSLDYGTVVHLCACGCGQEVVTPLSITDWELRYNGEAISLYPSIGNWNFPCRSHYWIINGAVQWARDWSEVEIEMNRKLDLEKKEKHIGKKKSAIHRLWLSFFS